jgi:hypothetical protein
MLGVVGSFGGIFLIARRLVARGLKASHKTLRTITGPWARVVAHTIILTGLYTAYHWIWEGRLPHLEAFAIGQ